MATKATFQEKMEKKKILMESFPSTGDVRAAQLAALLGIGVSTVWLYVKQGRIAQPKRLGARVSLWSAEYVHELRENGIPAQEAAQ